MMARPSVRALTKWGTLLGTTATIPVRAIWVTPSMVYHELALDYLIYFFLRMEILANKRTAATKKLQDVRNFGSANKQLGQQRRLKTFCRPSAGKV